MNESLMNLIHGYIEKSLSKEETAALMHLLETDSEFRAVWLEYMENESIAWEIGQQGILSMREQPDSEPLRTSRKSAIRSSQRPGYRRKNHIRWGAWGSIAACLVVIAGSLIYNYRQAERFPELVIARVTETMPNVKIIRANGFVIAVVNMHIRANDRIETKGNQTIRFGYEGEATEITVDENTVLDVGGVEEGKRLRLETGMLDAIVAPQPRGLPMVIATPKARVVIRGTAFSLAATGERTRLDVREGLVRLTRLSDDEFVDVTGGQYAVAADGVALAALSLPDALNAAAPNVTGTGGDGKLSQVPVPPFSGYEPGSIVFEDNFDTGLDSWEMVLGADPAHLSPREKKSRAFFRLMSKDKKSRKEDDLGDWMLTWAKIMKPRDGDTRTAYLRMREPVVEDAFQVEMFVGTDRHIGLNPFPWARVLKRQQGALSSTHGLPGNLHVRWECFPAGRAEDGAELMEIRTFIRGFAGGSSMGSYRNKGLLGDRPGDMVWVETTHVVCEDRRVGFVMVGKMDIRRIAIRRMVKK